MIRPVVFQPLLHCRSTLPLMTGPCMARQATVKARIMASGGNVSKGLKPGRYFGRERYLGPVCYFGSWKAETVSPLV